ncbi:unnamed protein product [Aphanomyces euteiches]
MHIASICRAICAVDGCMRFAKRDFRCLAHSEPHSPVSPVPHKMQLQTLLHKQRLRMSRTKTCAIDKCAQVARIDGFCTKHNMQFSSRKRKCTMDDCSSYARSSGLCARHGGGKPCSIDGCKSVSCSPQGLCRFHVRSEPPAAIEL